MTQARLIAKATADGLYKFHDDVPLGKIYNVDALHPQEVAFFHMEKQIQHNKIMVKDLDNPGWLPLECLAVES